MEDSKLIELVRVHPSVYNPKHHLYKDATVRDNVWIEIGLKMQLPAEECKNRWKNIRDTYMRRKKNNKMPTGSAAPRKTSRKWHLEGLLDFMAAADCERETLTNTSKEVIEAPTETVRQEPVGDTDDDETPDNIQDHEENNVPDRGNSTTPTQTQKRKQTEQRGADEASTPKQRNIPHSSGDAVPKYLPPTKVSAENIMKVFKKNSEDRSQILSKILEKPTEVVEHPIDIFLKSMAMTVKTFSPENQVRARLQICQTISQIELEELKRPTNIVRCDVTSPISSDSNISHVSVHSQTMSIPEDYDSEMNI